VEAEMKDVVPVERITSKIYLIRGQKVLLDRDLAQLYGVETRVLNQAVSRNVERFPADFMFALDRDEIRGISQTVTSSGIKYSKSVRAFTEQGVAMLSSVLSSNRAIQVNIQIMRAFTKLRQMLATHDDLRSLKLDLWSRNALRPMAGRGDSRIFQAQRMFPSEVIERWFEKIAAS
jgi:hypothetical protein